MLAVIVVFLFVLGAVNGAVQAVRGIVTAVSDLRGERLSPRLVEGALLLGTDLPIAAANYPLLPPQQPPDSTIRGNLVLLGLDVTYPPENAGPGPAASLRVVDEQIRPALARRDDDLLLWFDYGFYWGETQLSLAMLATIAVAPPSLFRDEREKKEIAVRLLASTKDTFRQEWAEATAEELDFPGDLRGDLANLHWRINRLESPEDVTQELLSEMDFHISVVLYEICGPPPVHECTAKLPTERTPEAPF